MTITKLKNINMDLRNMIQQNYKSLTCFSQILMTRKEANYIPVPMSLDITNLPEGFIYFEDEEILSETIKSQQEDITIFYKVGNTNMKALNLSTLVRFVRENQSIKTDIHYNPDFNDEQFSEIRFGKMSLIHDDLCNISYRLVHIQETPTPKFITPFSLKTKSTLKKTVQFKN